jgi:hypothetical protein
LALASGEAGRCKRRRHRHNFANAVNVSFGRPEFEAELSNATPQTILLPKICDGRNKPAFVDELGNISETG